MGFPEAADAAASLVRTAVADGVVPGAVLLAGRGAEGPVAAHAFGRTDSGPDARPVTVDTVFDLASLTKVVATMPAVLRLVEQGGLSLDRPVAHWLPRFSGGGHERVTVRQLLTHSSGLPAHRHFWTLPVSSADRLAAVLAEPLETAPGTEVRYSDLGFIVLGELVAEVAAQPLDRAVDALVLEPLGLTSTRYLPPADWRGRTAATEAPPGRPPKVGVVHDENAEALGGVAGHAGLFGTAPDLARCLRTGWLAEQGPLLAPALRAEALRNQTAGLGGVRGLGWTLRGDRWDHMSEAWPETGAGHTGFTGTSLALDPVGGLWAVLLTNAVHFGRDRRAVALRRTVHAALATAR